jgi:hypothetical protein
MDLDAILAGVHRTALDQVGLTPDCTLLVT